MLELFDAIKTDFDAFCVTADNFIKEYKNKKSK